MIARPRIAGWLLAIAACAAPASRLAATELPQPPDAPWQNPPTAPFALSPQPAAETIAPGEETETITERYPNRAVRIRRSVKQDRERNYINHGPWKMWDPQGRLIAEGVYVEDQRHGEWVRNLQHFAGAEPEFQAPFASKAEFAHGKLHGVWTITDGQQRVVGSWRFEQDVLDGESTIWHANGQERQRMSFRQGKPEGEAIAWKSDGTVWARQWYRDGKELVPVVTWHDHQQKESEGWLLRSSFAIHAAIDWWEGSIEITREDAPGEDVRVGKWTEWHENGTVRYAGTFDKGAPIGEHIWWHENGQKRLVGVYKSGLREGRWTAWHLNGQKSEEGAYLAGFKDGQWTVWDEDGRVAEVQQQGPGSEELPSPAIQPYSHVSLDELSRDESSPANSDPEIE